jgi:hypothetical protein
MPTAVTIRDETTQGQTTNELTLEFLDERVTVRELIRGRVYQEVTEYNARQAGLFKGLVQPKDAERTAGGFRLKTQRRLNWEEQYRKAIEAFGRNGFLILLDDRQLDDLDEVIELRHDATVSFLRLVPLVGG